MSEREGRLVVAPVHLLLKQAVIGFTWYSPTDQVDWDTALREEKDRVNTLGLYDLDRKIRPVGQHSHRWLRCGGTFFRSRVTARTCQGERQSGPARARPPTSVLSEQSFDHLTQLAATAIELVAAIILVAAVSEACIRLLAWAVRRERPAVEASRDVRLRMGQMVLSLEFLLPAKILSTAVSPAWDDLGKLAVIILLRNVLNTFLDREISAAASRARGETREQARSGG